MSGQRADARGGEARCQQRDSEGQRRTGVQLPGQTGVDRLQVVGVGEPAPGEQRRGHEEHRDVDEPGQAHGHRDVDALMPQQMLPLDDVRGRDPLLGERRMQIDRVRHDGGAEDAGREQDTAGTVEARHETSGGRPRIDVHAEQVDQEAQQDDREQPADHELEAAVAPTLQPQQPERHGPGEQTPDDQRQAEQQLQRDGAPGHLGQVGCHGHQLRLDPQAERHPSREVLPAQLGEVGPGRQAGLGRQGLHEHRHGVGDDDHPEQQIAVRRTAREVGREVARVDVRDRGHERGAEQRETPAQPSLGP